MSGFTQGTNASGNFMATPGPSSEPTDNMDGGDSVTQSVEANSESTQTASEVMHNVLEKGSEATLTDETISDDNLSGFAWESVKVENNEDIEMGENNEQNSVSESDRPGPKKLTARQQARQERLERGIHQTQWSDLNLPRGLDYGTKAKAKDELTEEEQLKRLKEAERRRLRMQKLRKENVESRKARIRAVTSAKFKEANGKSQSIPKMQRKTSSVECGMVKVQKRMGHTRVILPIDGELPEGLKPQSFQGYPQPRRDIDVEVSKDLVESGLDLKVGTLLKLAINEAKVWFETSEGLQVASIHNNFKGQIPKAAKVRCLKFDKGNRNAIRSITLRL